MCCAVRQRRITCLTTADDVGLHTRLHLHVGLEYATWFMAPVRMRALSVVRNSERLANWDRVCRLINDDAHAATRESSRIGYKRAQRAPSGSDSGCCSRWTARSAAFGPTVGPNSTLSGVPWPRRFATDMISNAQH